MYTTYIYISLTETEASDDNDDDDDGDRVRKDCKSFHCPQWMVENDQEYPQIILSDPYIPVLIKITATVITSGIILSSLYKVGHGQETEISVHCPYLAHQMITLSRQVAS